MLRPSSGLAGILLTSGQPLAIRRDQIAGTGGPRAHISVDVVAKSRCPLFAFQCRRTGSPAKPSRSRRESNSASILGTRSNYAIGALTARTTEE